MTSPGRALLPVLGLIAAAAILGGVLDMITQNLFQAASSFALVFFLPVATSAMLVFWAFWGAPSILRAMGAHPVPQSLSPGERLLLAGLEVSPNPVTLWSLHSEDPNAALIAPPFGPSALLVTSAFTREVTAVDVPVVTGWVRAFEPWARWFFWLSAPLAAMAILSAGLMALSAGVIRSVIALAGSMLIWPFYFILKMVATPWAHLEVDKRVAPPGSAESRVLAAILRTMAHSRSATVSSHYVLPQVWFFDPAQGTRAVSFLPPRLALSHPPVEMRLARLEEGLPKSQERLAGKDRL